jgi:hypothetical protein
VQQLPFTAAIASVRSSQDVLICGNGGNGKCSLSIGLTAGAVLIRARSDAGTAICVPAVGFSEEADADSRGRRGEGEDDRRIKYFDDAR